MRIGIVSDTHDNDEVVSRAVHRLRKGGVDLVLHCGDITTPETVRRFAGLPTHFVFGNWDGDLLPHGRGRRPRREGVSRNRDHSRLRRAIEEIGGTLHEPFGELEIEQRLIGWIHGHYRDRLRELEEADYFDYLFYGHTHEQEQHRTGRTLVVNPGALSRATPCTLVLLDLPGDVLETVRLT
jgi:putative phosphoesterase